MRPYRPALILFNNVFSSGKNLIYSSLIRASAVFFFWNYFLKFRSNSGLLFFIVPAVNTVFFPLPLFCFYPLSSFSSSFSLMEAKRSQSISNCVHLYEALPTTKSVPMLLHTVSSFLPGISSGNSACSHRLSGKVCSESCMCLCVCDLCPVFPFISHYLSYTTGFCVWCDSIWIREVYDLTRICLGLAIEKTHMAAWQCVEIESTARVWLCHHCMCACPNFSPMMSLMYSNFIYTVSSNALKKQITVLVCWL